MAIQAGERVRDPRAAEGAKPREGLVLTVERNPACLLRTVVVRWDDGEVEELAETEFGPLGDG